MKLPGLSTALLGTESFVDIVAQSSYAKSSMSAREIIRR
jgi:hypothetical protein